MPLPTTTAGIAEPHRREAHRVDRHRRRLDQRRLLEAERIGQAVDDAARHRDELGEGAVPPVLAGGDAEHHAVVAEVDVAARAEDALAAIDGGVEGDAIAAFQVANVGAGALHHAGRFVSHDERRNAASGGSVQAVDVAAADSAGADANQHVVGPDLRLVHLDHFQFHVFGEQQCIHVSVMLPTRREPATRTGVYPLTVPASFPKPLSGRVGMLAQIASLLHHRDAHLELRRAAALDIRAARGDPDARAALRLPGVVLRGGDHARVCTSSSRARNPSELLWSTFRTAGVAVWFAPACILLSQLSPATLLAALVLVITATRLLYSEWSRRTPPAPRAAPVPPPGLVRRLDREASRVHAANCSPDSPRLSRCRRE